MIEFLNNASSKEYYEYFKDVPKGEEAAILSKKLSIIKTDIEINIAIEDLKLIIDKNIWDKEFQNLEFSSLYM